jgi:ATP phosphoribosyltransferase regulatory subunit
MSKPRVFEKPIGVKDYLPEAVEKLRAIESRVLECMRGWGYREIITPTLEYYDTVGVASSTSDRKLFKLLDRKGTTVVLRSDMTAPIARVVASLLKERPFPLRLSYYSNVFRAIEEEAGRDAEFFQAGGELVGDDSADADAEVVALAIASLKAAGVTQFKIALGHVGFLNGLFEETLAGQEEAQTALKDCLLKRDHVGYRELLAKLELPERLRLELEGVLRLRGGQEVCELALGLTHNTTAEASIRHLCEIWEVLKCYGVSEHVLIDLTNIGDFSYYTGMTFEGYAADLGFPVCSGGRYDNLLAQFGRPAPATGFALRTNRIMEVVSRDAVDESKRTLILYTASQREDALHHARTLRAKSGAVVETILVGEGEQPEVRLDGESYSYQGQSYQDVIQYIGGVQP